MRQRQTVLLTLYERAQYIPNNVSYLLHSSRFIIPYICGYTFYVQYSHRQWLLLNLAFKICNVLCERLNVMPFICICLCCSSLNYDLFRKKLITDSSLCTCNQVETTVYFLLYCPLYNRQRQLCFQDLSCPPTVNNTCVSKALLFLQNDLILRRWY